MRWVAIAIVVILLIGGFLVFEFDAFGMGGLGGLVMAFSGLALLVWAEVCIGRRSGGQKPGLGR